MLVLPVEFRDQLGAEARSALPDECCGLLEGLRDGETVTVTALHPAANVSPVPRDGFAIDPAVHFALLRRLRGSGRAVVGCYHSHPNGRAEPSDRDRACGDWGGCADRFVWIILATGVKDSIRAFSGPDFQPLTIRVCP